MALFVAILHAIRPFVHQCCRRPLFLVLPVFSTSRIAFEDIDEDPFLRPFVRSFLRRWMEWFHVLHLDMRVALRPLLWGLNLGHRAAR